MAGEEHIFISDVHLGAFSKEMETQIEDDLIALIEYAIINKARLYVLGDLFDYWMEFPNSKHLPKPGLCVREAFARYNKEVESALFITGNHDNWTLGYFEELGFDMEENYKIVDLENQRLLLMHGDGVFNTKGCFTRGWLHRLLRNDTFLKIYRGILTPGLGIFLMRLFSQLSKTLEREDLVTLTKNAAWATEHLPVDIVICGHDHAPRTEHLEHGLYINTGTFFHHKTVARCVNGEFTLAVWQPSTNDFAPFS